MVATFPQVAGHVATWAAFLTRYPTRVAFLHAMEQRHRHEKQRTWCHQFSWLVTQLWSLTKTKSGTPRVPLGKNASSFQYAPRPVSTAGIVFKQIIASSKGDQCSA